MAHPLDTSPKNLLAVWAADGQDMQPACLFTVGAARLQLQEEPVSKHGNMVFEELSDRLGAFSCRGGKRGATHAERSRKHKTGLGYSRQSSSDLSLHWAPALGPTWTLGSRISCYKTLISLKHTGLGLCWEGERAGSCDRQAQRWGR